MNIKWVNNKNAKTTKIVIKHNIKARNHNTSST